MCRSRHCGDAGFDAIGGWQTAWASVRHVLLITPVAVVALRNVLNSAKLWRTLRNCFFRRRCRGKNLEIRDIELRNFCAQTFKRAAK